MTLLLEGRMDRKHYGQYIQHDCAQEKRKSLQSLSSLPQRKPRITAYLPMKSTNFLADDNVVFVQRLVFTSPPQTSGSGLNKSSNAFGSADGGGPDAGGAEFQDRGCVSASEGNGVRQLFDRIEVSHRAGLRVVRISF